MTPLAGDEDDSDQIREVTKTTTTKPTDDKTHGMKEESGVSHSHTVSSCESMSSPAKLTPNDKQEKTTAARNSLIHTEQYNLIKVSSRYVALSFLSCVLVGFSVGWVARVLLLDLPQQQLRILVKQQQQNVARRISPFNDRILKLPTPILPGGKVLPHTTYISKAFDTTRSTISSRWVVTEEGKQQCVDLPGDDCPAGQQPSSLPLNGSSFFTKAAVDVDDDEEGDNEIIDEIYMPEGQHLLVDIENVDSIFLDSEERLAYAMLELVNKCGLTLLSYHCHGLVPTGVSCAGVLLESHVAFHTWPAEGVISLDLFSCGDMSLFPIVPLIERLFSIPQAGATKKPQMVWAHKYRGVHDESEDDISDLTDFYKFPMGVMSDFKVHICSEETDYQRVDIVDVLRPQYQNMKDYQRSLQVDGSYESMHPEFFQPDRIVFLDGVLQSRRSGDAAYHEALVHPGMFAHPNPKRVAIIGGGEGATLREVLKHSTVKKVVMIEIDEEMVRLSREFLPEWSDCSMIDGSAQSCFDDPRAETYFVDAFEWFTSQDDNMDPFDIIIMDALDPQVEKAFVDALYDQGPFLVSLTAAIAEDGILIAQVGEASDIDSPPEDISLNHNRLTFIDSLVELGFRGIRDYEEAHVGFEKPWQFMVGFRSPSIMNDWTADASLLDYKIRQRTLPNLQGGSSLHFFDGPAMSVYSFPSKGSEVVYCRRKKDSPDCLAGHGFDQEMDSYSVSALDLKQHEETLPSLSVRANKDMRRGSYVGLDAAIHSLTVKPAAIELLGRLKRVFALAPVSRAHMVSKFVTDFGRRPSGNDIVISTSLHAFIREDNAYACNASLNLSGGNIALHYNPLLDRQVHRFRGVALVADVRAGSELLSKLDGACESIVGEYRN